MTQPAKAVDIVARRVIRAAEEDLRHWIGVAQLENELLGELYLRVREVLDRGDCDDRDSAVDDIALTIYLTASAWESRGSLPLKLLSSLQQAIAQNLPVESFPIAPDSGARRNQ